MRKVIASEFLSLDGAMEDPGGAEGSEYGGWSFAYFNEELSQVIGGGSPPRTPCSWGGRLTRRGPTSGRSRTRRRTRTLRFLTAASAEGR